MQKILRLESIYNPWNRSQAMMQMKKIESEVLQRAAEQES